MTEKRFTVMKKFDGSYVICDKGKMLVADDCCDLLNTMSDDIEEVEISIKLFEDDVQIKDKKIDEQQATIRKLQDLCGESDGENAKLRRENKKLKEENEQLRQQVQILKKEVRDFLHLCDVCDIQSHLSDECEEVLNDE